jgi:RNA polymerase sigma-70 factor (ECF subfamily)
LKNNRQIKSTSDIDLARDFVNTNNQHLLGELYSRYMHLVYGVCLKYLKNKEDAKDATMGIFEKLPDLLSRTLIKNFKSWLHVVTKNYCLMILRKRSSKTKIQIEVAFEAQKFVENVVQIHPIDGTINEKLLVALNDCIEQLKEKQKNCIKLFYFENNCYRKIASQLHTDEKEVKSNIQNGKRNLKNCLDKEYEIRKSI